MSYPTRVIEESWSDPGQVLDEPLDEGYYRGNGRSVTFLDEADLIDRISPAPTEVHIDIEVSDIPPLECRPLIREYGEQWDWDQASEDYIRFNNDGVKLLYADYQTAGIIIPRAPTAPGTNASTCTPFPDPRIPSIPRPVQPPTPRSRPHETARNEGFSVILKPKRFFCVGRIFKAIWLEPSSHGENLVPRFRWFAVARRQPHQSLCFSITAYNRQGSSSRAAGRGRPGDLVVLHSANIEPPRPYPEEGITRDPIAVIIEGREQYIAPIARLDCGRVVTVEDNVKVMKVGRVHPGSIALLEQYYTECVLL